MADDGLFVLPRLRGEGTSLLDRPLAVVDLETTGFSPGPDRAIEIGIVRVDPSGVIVDEWTTLVHPGRDVGPTWVHGVTDEMVADAPSFAEVADEILDRFEGAVVVAHNAPFDGGFLAHEFASAGLPVPALPAACTLQVARWSGLGLPNYRLATCCEAFGLTNAGAHSALGDARVTAELAVQLFADPPDLRWPLTPPALPRSGRRADACPRPPEQVPQ